MENSIQYDEVSQKMTHQFKSFQFVVDFKEAKMFAEFDFKEKKMSLADYQNILNEFAELDKKFEAMAIGNKPLSEITIGEFMQLIN